jgi:hypothetical protein
MVFVDDNVVRSRQMRVFLLCSQVPIFLALPIIVLEDLNHPMYPFLRTIEYFGLFISESFVVCFSVNLFVVDDSRPVSSMDHR